MILPFVEAVLEAGNEDINYSNVYIIGVQHVVETLHAMFRSFFKRGLRPENVMILGKCYSTNDEVYNEMIGDGIDVDSGSFAYSSHSDFDSTFDSAIDKFFEERVGRLFLDAHDKTIIVLDDGGRLLQKLDKFSGKVRSMIGIEQTSAGYNAIKNKEISFPIINVARSPTKLKYESPLISKAAIERIDLAFRDLPSPTNCLVIGGGIIGQAVHADLSTKVQCEIFDISSNRGHSTCDIGDILHEYDCLIGCTGVTSVPNKIQHRIKQGATLISVSSSDREFDAVHLRRRVPKNSDCHKNLIVGDLYLVNSGFPVNFDGERENIDPSLIQLTLALIASAIVFACSENKPKKNNITPLPILFENAVESLYLNQRRLSAREPARLSS